MGQKNSIKLDSIFNPIVDLSGYENEVRLYGNYFGPRIIFKNASDHKLVFWNAFIRTTHSEDAIAFEGSVSNLRILGYQFTCTGAITFWGHVTDLYVYGVKLKSAHTGIRITQDFPHKNISVLYCKFTGISHEGVYIGVSKDTPSDLSNVKIIGNEFDGIGWDAIQVGNCLSCEIYDNTVKDAGNRRMYGQDYGITINPGSIAYLDNNKILKTDKKIQVLDSRAFFHKKKDESGKK